MAHQISSSNQLSATERTPLMEHSKLVGDDHVEKRRSRPSSPKTHQEKTEKDTMDGLSNGGVDQQSGINFISSSLPGKEETNSTRITTYGEASNSTEENGRERLKRHRVEMAGRVWIPDIWGQEDFLKDWIDCSAFDTCLGPNGLISARASLIEEGRRATSGGLRIENRC